MDRRVSAHLLVTILGCGSSGGVPRLGNDWGACDPTEKRNWRRRCSVLFERVEGDKRTRVLIDTSPDIRMQLLEAKVGLLDAVLFTHAHADHVHGLDDLRVIVLNRGAKLPIWADEKTLDVLRTRFAYAFATPAGSLYSPILEPNQIIEGQQIKITGAGGVITSHPFLVPHGKTFALGFRINDVVYLPDISQMSKNSWQALEGASLWIIDALRYTPHPTHTHLAQTLEWIAQSKVPRAILTNMHVDLDYRTIERETPDNVSPAYDGMQLKFPA